MIDYTRRDKQGKTPLMLAVGLEKDIIVHQLLDMYKEKGLDVGINQPDNKGRTPAMVAAALGNKEALSALINAGANLSLLDGEGH
ncbi:MAG: ankyrin repeat domain-containing protein [Legionella sp.]